MSLFGKVREMLGFHPKPKAADFVAVDVSRAVQRNEQSAERMRKALEEIKMTDTMRELVGKM